MAYNPKGRPSKAYRYIIALSGGKGQINKTIKSETDKQVKKLIKRGRPASTTEHLRVLGGSLRVKTAKSRTIRVGNKELSI